MLVCDFPQGRYGNAIFRYLASSLFCILYDADRTYEETDCDTVFSDTDFIEWSTQILYNNVSTIDTTKKYIFVGYYQHDKIFQKYKSLLIEHIHRHPNDRLITDGYKPGGKGLYHYNVVKYAAIDLVQHRNTFPVHDIVVHLRLEDFVYVNQCIHPKYIADVLENFGEKQICFVVNNPKTPFEHRYISYFESKFSIICESNDPVTDYHIIKNAKTLVCSRSTMCWAAAFFSDTLETVYFPNYTNPSHIHETFKQPIENTVLYDIKLSSEYEINVFFDENGI
jgi:hypothetical protein